MAQMRFLITDNGTHPPEKWAEVIVDDLVQIDPNAPPDKAQAGLQLRHNMIAELIPAIADAQSAEKEGRHGKSCHCHPHINSMAAAINKVAGSSIFKEHFKRPEVQERIRNVCGIHATTAMKIEADHKHNKENGQAGNGPHSHDH